MATARRPARRWLHRAGLVGIAGLLFTAALAGCADDDDDVDTSSEASASADDAADVADEDGVVLELIAFSPDTLTVEPGTTVTWSHQDGGNVHTVTSGTVTQQAGGVSATADGMFDSGRLSMDDTFEFTFDEAGTYTYFCGIHPATMRGEITVT